MTIVKRGNKHCVVSEKGKNLGCSPSHGGAVKRLAQVEYFKHAHKSLTEDAIIKSMDEGSMRVEDAELMPWMIDNKSLFKSHGVDLEELDTKSIFSGTFDGPVEADQHISSERLRFLLFDILAGADPPDWDIQTFEEAGVVSNDDGLVVKDGCGCIHELAVIMTNAGQVVTSAESSAVASGGGFDPEAELAQDVAAYLNGDIPPALVQVRSVPSMSFNDGAELVFDDGTVLDVFIRGTQQQAHDEAEKMVASPVTPVVTMQMMSGAAHAGEAKSAAVSYQCFDQMAREYAPTEAGELMTKGRMLFDNGSYAQASVLFQKARDLFDRNTHPTATYWECLNDWSGYANDLDTQYPTAIGTKSEVEKAGNSEGAKNGWQKRKRSGGAWQGKYVKRDAAGNYTKTGIEPPDDTEVRRRAIQRKSDGEIDKAGTSAGAKKGWENRKHAPLGFIDAEGGTGPMSHAFTSDLGHRGHYMARPKAKSPGAKIEATVYHTKFGHDISEHDTLDQAKEHLEDMRQSHLASLYPTPVPLRGTVKVTEEDKMRIREQRAHEDYSRDHFHP